MKAVSYTAVHVARIKHGDQYKRCQVLKYACAAAKCCLNPERFTTIPSLIVRDNTIYLTEVIIVSGTVNVIIIHAACFTCRFHPEYYVRVTT